MSLLKKIFGGGNPIAGAVLESANGVADIVERWAPSDEKKHEMYMQIQQVVQDGAAAARAYDPRTVGQTPFVVAFNAVVDGISRLIRPGVTILLIGAVFGWWPMATETIDPVILGWSEAVMVFWFGARTLFKDIPTLVNAIKQSRS